MPRDCIAFFYRLQARLRIEVPLGVTFEEGVTVPRRPLAGIRPQAAPILSEAGQPTARLAKARKAKEAGDLG